MFSYLPTSANFDIFDVIHINDVIALINRCNIQRRKNTTHRQTFRYFVSSSSVRTLSFFPLLPSLVTKVFAQAKRNPIILKISVHGTLLQKSDTPHKENNDKDEHLPQLKTTTQDSKITSHFILTQLGCCEAKITELGNTNRLVDRNPRPYHILAQPPQLFQILYLHVKCPLVLSYLYRKLKYFIFSVAG